MRIEFDDGHRFPVRDDVRRTVAVAGRYSVLGSHRAEFAFVGVVLAVIGVVDKSMETILDPGRSRIVIARRLSRRLATTSSHCRSRVWSRVKTVSSHGVPSVSLQVSQIEFWLMQAKMTTSQMSPVLRELPSTPGNGSGVMTSSATSFTSNAERHPSGSGRLNTS